MFRVEDMEQIADLTAIEAVAVAGLWFQVMGLAKATLLRRRCRWVLAPL
jgi:hypothetical protein